MGETPTIEIRRSRQILAGSALLFISSIIAFAYFIVELQMRGLRFQTVWHAVLGILFAIFGYLIFSVKHLTTGMSLSIVVGVATILNAVANQSIGYSAILEGSIPTIAGIIGYYARKKVDWLIEREAPRFRELRFTLRMMRRNKVTLGAIIVIIFFYGIAIFGPYLTPYDPLDPHLKNRLEGPSSQFILGTDSLGRDILSRLIHGTRISMIVGVVVVGMAVLIGLPLGAISGYLGGKMDELIMRFTDIVMAFPGLTLAMLFAYIMGRGLFSAIVGLSLVSWTVIARLVRGVVLSEKEKEYVTAARVLGKNDFQILFGEIIPNSLHTVIVTAMMSLGTTIIAVAGLSFVGVGIQPPTPDWGVMINEGRQFLLDQPLFALVPGFMIISVVLAYNVVGDSLRDALDPTLRRQA